MKTVFFMVSVVFVHLLFSGCAKSDPEVRVSNRYEESLHQLFRYLRKTKDYLIRGGIENVSYAVEEKRNSVRIL